MSQRPEVIKWMQARRSGASREAVKPCKGCGESKAEKARLEKIREAYKAVPATPKTPFVIIPCRNEGDRLAQTVRCLRTGNANIKNVVVADDDSDDGCTKALLRARDWQRLRRRGAVTVKCHSLNLTIIRGERNGVGRARHIAGTFACSQGASSLLFMDSHVYANPIELSSLAELAEDMGVIIQPSVLSWDLHSKMHRYGGNLGWNRNRILGVGYVKRASTETLGEVSGLIGANGYAVPRACWDKMGGWSQNCGLWGFNEQLLSIKSWFCGIKMYCHRDYAAAHFFKKSGGGNLGSGRNSMVERWRSRYAVLRVLFSEEAFWKVWFPLLHARFQSPVLEDAMSEPGILAERDDWLPRRERTEQEFFDTFLPKLEVKL